MDFTNWICEYPNAVREAAEQAFGLKEFARMSSNRFDEYGRETAFYAELTKVCEEFKRELIKRGEWEDFASEMGMEA